MADHMTALRAVARDRVGVPNCPDRLILAAAEAKLIRFHGWPSGHWQITDAGVEYMNENAYD